VNSSYLFCFHDPFLPCLLQQANDVELNPGPVEPIKGICRTCGKHGIEEMKPYLLSHFLSEYESGIKRLFENAEALWSDDPLNPKFVCVCCAKAIRASSGLPKRTVGIIYKIMRTILYKET
jgi:hypothetical protein